MYINNSVHCYITLYLLHKSTSMYKLGSFFFPPVFYTLLAVEVQSLRKVWLNNVISLSLLMVCTCVVVSRVLPMVLVYCMPSQHHSIKFHQVQFLTKHRPSTGSSYPPKRPNHGTICCRYRVKPLQFIMF